MEVIKKSIESVINFKSEPNVQTESTVFKLHYKVTVIALAVFSVLITSKQYFGDPIKCVVDNKDYKEYAETYCWLYGTYVYEGSSDLYQSDLPKKWQSYYQWVPLIFAIQALFFYVPYYLWSVWEGNKMHFLAKDLDGPFISPAWTSQKKLLLVEYLTNGNCAHNLYAARYGICEILNFTNLVLQCWVLDLLLNNEFLSYGLTHTQSHSDGQTHVVFPMVAKCKWETFGSGGSNQVHDGLCMLTMNVLNEKLFLALWVWFLFLGVLSSLALVYRAFVIFCPSIRVCLMMSQTRCVPKTKIEAIARSLSYGDFFVLYYLGKNVNPLIYQDLLLSVFGTLQDGAKKKKNYMEA